MNSLEGDGVGSGGRERFMLEPNRGVWDAFVALQPRAHVLQLSGYGELKSAFGWGVKRICIFDKKSEVIGGAQVLLRSMPGSTHSMAYLPMGPYITGDCTWLELWGALDAVLSPVADFLRWEPGIYRGEVPFSFEEWGFKRSEDSIQPPRTIVIDLSRSEAEILARMNQGTRRKIRRCKDAGVEIYHGGEVDIEAFNELMLETAERKSFRPRDPEYYKLAYHFYQKGRYVDLLMAKFRDKSLAGLMIFTVGDTAWYLYGASSDYGRDLMASYGLQWEAIKLSKSKGCQWYDLWGVPDYDTEILESQFKERSDGLWGVYGFKRGFGGSVVRSLGAWDKIYRVNRAKP